jgi:phage protein D
VETLKPPVPHFVLRYAGRDITADVAPYVTSITYTDQLMGESDSLDIDLEDADGRWVAGWYPEKGATLTLDFGYRNAALVAAGHFDLDELELAGPPSTVRIRGLAAGLQKAVRTRNARGYEDVTLTEIVARIAAQHGMAVVGDIAPLQLDRVTQYQEGDLLFLQRLANQYGYIFRVDNNNARLVFSLLADLHLQPAIRRYSPSQLNSWSLRDAVSGAPRGARVQHQDTDTKSLVVYGVENGETTVVGTTSADEVKVTRRATSSASAEAQAQAELDKRLLERISGEISVEGDPGLAAGANIELNGFGKLSGLYLITRATHTITRSEGYTTALELKRPVPAESA